VAVAACIVVGVLATPGCDQPPANRDQQVVTPERTPNTTAPTADAPESSQPTTEPRQDDVTESPQPSEASGLVPPKVQVVKKDKTLEAMALARSTEPADHDRLRALLTDEEHLRSLDTPDEYLRLPVENLQLHFVLTELSDNTAAPALETLDQLARHAAYREPGPRPALLLLASGKIGEVPAGIRQLWKEQLDADADELELAVAMVVANGSVEAISILEDALLHQSYDQDQVIAWLQDPILTHRQDVPLLAMCERLLRSEDWPGQLRTVLVEVLFDYRPDAWYMIDVEPPRPPSRDALSAAARERLIAIADLALREGMIDKARRAEIDAQLAAE